MRSIVTFVLMALAANADSAAVGATDKEKCYRAQLVVSGDDGLTTGFANELRQAISQSRHFTLSGERPLEIRFYLAGGLYWQETEQGTNFNVVVVFVDSKDKYLGISKGACWAESQMMCANRVVADAYRAITHAHVWP